MIQVSSLLKDALHLFYPHQCISCGDDVLPFDKMICNYCFENLPRTQFSSLSENSIDRIFYGRLNLKAAHSEFYFSKGQLIQSLIHQLKYNGNKEVGVYLGQLMGQSLLMNNRFKEIDFIVPVPMFRQKEIKRGYNQADIIAQGVADAMQIPVAKDLVQRIQFTSTQTKKDRTERWDNVKNTFMIKNEQLFKNKSVLLIDDVITTGATLESCGETILQIPGAILSIATLAYAIV
jgi:ComF family protein